MTLAILPHMLRGAILSEALATGLVCGSSLCGPARLLPFPSLFLLCELCIELLFSLPRCEGVGSVAPGVDSGLCPDSGVVGIGARRMGRVRNACIGVISYGGTNVCTWAQWSTAGPRTALPCLSLPVPSEPGATSSG